MADVRHPHSIYHQDTAGRTGYGVYSGAGGNNASHDQGIQVKASLDADSTVEFRFAVPPIVPSGTLKARLIFLANATSGTIKFTVQDATVSVGASPSAASLTSETQSSLTWAAGDNDKYKEIKVTLTAAPVGNDELVIAVKFQTTSWTLAQILTALITIIWE